MKKKQVTAMLLSGILLCLQCTPAAAGNGMPGMPGMSGNAPQRGFQARAAGTASPSDALDKSDDEDEWFPPDGDLEYDLEGTQEATPSDAELEDMASPSDAEEEDSFFYRTEVDGTVVTIEAEPGILPEGTTVEIARIEETEDVPIRTLVEDSQAFAGKQIERVEAFDISLWYEGEEIEPEFGTVTVTFQAVAMAERDGLDKEVFHVEADTQEVKLVEDTEQQDDCVVFQAEHFSVYGFVLMAAEQGAWDIAKQMDLYPVKDSTGGSSSLSEQEDRIHILLFGRAGSCANTMKTANGLDNLMTDQAAERVSIHLLDIDNPREYVEIAAEQAEWNYVTTCSKLDNTEVDVKYYQNYMQQLLRQELPENQGLVMLPVTFIFDSNQNLTFVRQGLVDQASLAGELLDIDSSLVLNQYISAEQIYQVNEKLFSENKSNVEALKYYASFNAEKYPNVAQKAEEITAGCSTDSEKLRAIYEWVAENVCYDRDSFHNGTSGYTDPDQILTMSPMRCVCQGYANLIRDLCRAVGIPCREVNGYALGVGAESYWTAGILNGNETNHAWNEAYINEQWNILDATWDSQNVYENSHASYENMTDTYFGISLHELSRDHKIVSYEEADFSDITNLRVTKQEGEVRLEWDVESSLGNRGSVIVYKKNAAGEYEKLYEGPKRSYTDSSVSPGETCYYKVAYVADNGYESAGQEIQVLVQRTDAEISIPSSESLYIGQKKKLEVTFTNYEGARPEVVWSSDDDRTVTVDAAGNITGVAYGWAYITARCGTKSSRCWVQVLNLKEVANVRVTDNYAGYIRLQWDAQECTSVVERTNQQSGEAEILGETRDGVYEDKTAVAGVAYLYHIYNQSGSTMTEGIRLEVPASSSAVRLPEHMALKTGTKRLITPEYTGFGETLPTVSWSSSNPDVAVVDGQGNVSAVSEGMAEIVLKVGAGNYQSVTSVYCASGAYKDECTSTELEVIKLVNKERMANGLKPVSLTAQMQQAAHIRKAEVKAFYSHTRPDGTSCFTVLDELGIYSFGAGENIAYGYGSPASVMDAWMNSSGHRANILNSGFSHMGAGEVNNSWIQMFIGCSGKEAYTLLVPDGTLTVRKGTAVENLGVVVVSYCDNMGIGYIPLAEAMCDGYNANTIGEQLVTVSFGDFSETFRVTVEKGSSGSSGGGGGSSSGGGGGGGGGSSSGGSAGVVGGSAAVGPGIGGAAPAVNQVDTLPEYVMSGTWESTVLGWRLKKPDNTYAANQWAQLDGRWYLLGADGYMRTGWQMVHNVWYFMNVDGSMAVGWVLDKEKWYYLNPNGAMATGNIQVDGITYLLGADGAWVQ